MVDVDRSFPVNQLGQSVPPVQVKVDLGTEAVAQVALSVAEKAWRDNIPGEVVYRLLKAEEERQNSLATLYGWDKTIQRTLSVCIVLLVCWLCLVLIRRVFFDPLHNNKKQKQM